MLKVLFHRDYRHFQGGHLKVRDYYRHVKAAHGFEPRIYMTPQSSPKHIWREERLVDRYDPTTADILFVAGMDWKALDQHPGIEREKPVINLIQGLRHADSYHPLSKFLDRRAVRVCVSQEVADAVLGTGRCNGPVQVIPNGIDFAEMVSKDKTVDVFIGGMKNPGLAHDLEARLMDLGMSIDCQTEHIPRSRYLDRLSRARIAVLLPLPTEGFFLPALEAMALGSAVVCPDCVGNRSFCLNGTSALAPPCSLSGLLQAIMRLRANPALVEHLVRHGFDMAQRHSIEDERRSFIDILTGAALGSSPALPVSS